MLDCYYNSKARMIGMDVMDPRDQLGLRDQWDHRDHRDQPDPMDVMDSGDQLDSMDVMDSRDQLDFPVQRGKREIEEYSYEGFLGHKVQVVPSYF